VTEYKRGSRLIDGMQMGVGLAMWGVKFELCHAPDAGSRDASAKVRGHTTMPSRPFIREDQPR
jgi:hypothetical protein